MLLGVGATIDCNQDGHIFEDRKAKYDSHIIIIITIIIIIII